MQSTQSTQSTMSGEHTIVFFDLETTGFGTMCQITQISAVSGERLFNVYTLPTCTITDKASQITGFTVSNGALLLHGRPVDTVSLHQALSSFITFLRSFRQPLLLAAHNAKRFDVPVLARVLNECSLMRDFQEVVSTFLDTLKLSKQLYPRLAKYSQEYLFWHFLNKSYDAHNALEDVKALQELYKKWNPETQKLLPCTFQLPDV